MPDNLLNTLVITAPKAVLEEILALVILKDEKGKDWFDFNKVFPYPKRFADLDKKAQEWDYLFRKPVKDGGCPQDHKMTKERKKWFDDHPRIQDGYNSGGYHWCIATWGSKWNSYDTKKVVRPKRKYKEDKGEEALFVVKIRFKTAYEPPTPIIYGLAAIFPEAYFTLKYRMEYHKMDSERSFNVHGPSRMQFINSLYPPKNQDD